MNVLMTGSTGLIGSALVPFLKEQGHRVTRLVRSPPSLGTGEVHWQPQSDSFITELPDAPDAVVHLAGEAIAGRWSKAKKERIRASRIDAGVSAGAEQNTHRVATGARRRTHGRRPLSRAP